MSDFHFSKKKELRYNHDEEAAAWKAHWEKPSAGTINAIIMIHAPYVSHVAFEMSKRLPCEVDVESMAQEGILGLRYCIDRFDPAQKNTFRSFSALRVKGAMLDYLRNTDFAPRVKRARGNQVRSVQEAHYKSTGRMPDDEEMRNLLKVDKKWFSRIIKDGQPRVVLSMNRRVSSTKNTVGMLSSESDKAIEFDTIDRRETTSLDQCEARDVLSKFIRQLTGVERLIAYYTYVHDVAYAAIAHITGLTESRVSQIHTVVIDDFEQFCRTHFPSIKYLDRVPQKRPALKRIKELV